MITTQNSVLSGAPTPQELELINNYTVKPLSADEVYTFGIVLCDNEIDRDFERFDILALEKNAALIEEIDAGIKKETSVGCSVGRSVCSICGKDGRTDPCAHIKGREYGGKLCHRILCDPTDAYEWSFVAVPAQPAAGVTKSYRADEQTVKTVKRLSCANEGVTLTKAEAAGLYGYIDELEQLAREGKEYREELICDVIRMGAAALPDMRGESLSAICGTLGLEQLRELKKAFSGGGKLNSQLSSTKLETHSGNSEFRI